ELDRLITAESRISEERDQVRRTRDTARADENTLSQAQGTTASATNAERRANDAAVGAYIRAAEAAWAAAEHAETTERHAVARLTEDSGTIGRSLESLRTVHIEAGRAVAAAGIDPERLGRVPEPTRVVLAPRESTTRVDLQGLEQAVEREPVEGVDTAALREHLGALHDQLTTVAEIASQRADRITRMTSLTTAESEADRRSVALNSETESAAAVVERAHAREQEAITELRSQSAAYAEGVRDWTARLRDSNHAHALGEAIHELENSVELPISDTLRALAPEAPEARARPARHARRRPDPARPGCRARLARAAVAPPLEALRARRDVAVGEAGRPSDDLADLTERRTTSADHAPERPGWSTHPRAESDGVPFHRAVDFVAGLSTREQAGLEAALEASGILAGWIQADGSLYDPSTRDLVLVPARAAKGRTLLDVLVPVPVPGQSVHTDTVRSLLASIVLQTESGGGLDES